MPYVNLIRIAIVEHFEFSAVINAANDRMRKSTVALGNMSLNFGYKGRLCERLEDGLTLNLANESFVLYTLGAIY